MNIFQRYSPTIQRYIYQEGWQSLRAIQAAAGDAIFNTDANVLLSASTASGKTEAAFFPIITLMQEEPPTSVGCLYIAPLKALINDQFGRLNDICAESGISVWHWHGDVSQDQKKKLMRHPSGILQITPESLEAMVMRRHSQLPHLFGDLRFIVIDEIHSFLRGDRGGQTLALIERLGRIAGVNPRRIGLSATIGDPQMVGQLLGAGTGRGTVIPRIKAPGAKWRISMEHFWVGGSPSSSSETSASASTQGTDGVVTGNVVRDYQGGEAIGHETYNPFESDLEPSRPSEARRQMKGGSPFVRPWKGTNKAGGDSAQSAPGEGAGSEPGAGVAGEAFDASVIYLLRHTRGHKCLIFTNSREECETLCATLRQYCEVLHESDRFLIHHGNLSVSYRQSAEEMMKEENNITVCTTSTLELGIDIGRLERAFQIDAPFTVSSFLQRMGRTGRRGAPSEMWFVIREDAAEARALLPARIPWKLLQAIALVQLYVEEKWVEPPRKGRLPYSLLYHQTMSTLASEGEMSPRELASKVLTLSPFANVSQDDFRVLLRHLIKIDHVEVTEGGGLIVGIAGEKVVNNFKFYAVFQENEEYSVRCESQEIGTIVKPPPVRDKIAIAGRVWVVEEVDRKRHVVYCHPVKGIIPAYFGDEPGDIHTKILERMRLILAPPVAPGVRAALPGQTTGTGNCMGSNTGAGNIDNPNGLNDGAGQVCSDAGGGVATMFAAAGCAPLPAGEGLGERLRAAPGGAYPYLLPHARQRLAQALDSARHSGLGVRWLLPMGGKMYCLTPWLGSYAFLALERFLRIRCGGRLGLKGFDSQRPYYMQFSMDVSPDEFFAILADEISKPLDPMELLYPNETPVFDKYDDLLPVELTRKGFACGVLDIEGMRQRVVQMTNSQSQKNIGERNL